MLQSLRLNPRSDLCQHGLKNQRPNSRYPALGVPTNASNQIRWNRNTV